MSSKLIALVFERYPVGGGEMVLALKLADIADDEGRSVVQKLSSLARSTRQSERQVQRQLKAMLGAGFLEVVAHAEGGRGNVPEYSVNKGWIANPGAVGLRGADSCFGGHDSDKSTTDEAHIKGDICDIKGDKMSPFNTVKGDICDIKGDKMSPFSELNLGDENPLIYKALKIIKKITKKDLPKKQALMFSQFWDRWPSAKHKSRKMQCLALWQTHDFDSQIQQISEHVEATIVSSESAMSDGGEYLISPLNYLRSEDWKTPVPSLLKAHALSTGLGCAECGAVNVGFKRGGRSLCRKHFRNSEE